MPAELPAPGLADRSEVGPVLPGVGDEDLDPDEMLRLAARGPEGGGHVRAGRLEVLDDAAGGERAVGGVPRLAGQVDGPAGRGDHRVRVAGRRRQGGRIDQLVPGLARHRPVHFGSRPSVKAA